MTDPRSNPCLHCGAIAGDPCITRAGSFRVGVCTQRLAVKKEITDWQRKYDLLYRVEPVGGYFGSVWRIAA